MPDDHEVVAKLRTVLRDPRWSLRPWPDAEFRVRRAARRQRRVIGGVSAGVSAIILAAVIVPLTLLPPGRGGQPVTSAPRSSSSPTASPTPSALTPPPVGAPGFPVSIYPPPPSTRELNLIGQCPSPSGLDRTTRSTGAAALHVLEGLGRSFRSDLQLSDRVDWPQLLANWRQGQVSQDRHPHVLYSGPLESYHQGFGPPDVSRTVAAGCGSQAANGTWLIVVGSTSSPALQGEYLFLDRRGHVLVWNAQ